MACFPWERATLVRPSFVCAHCGSPLREEWDKVVVCSCAESIAGEHEERQRRINFQREREETLSKKDHKVHHGS